jgi:hypothetical protein
MLNRHVGAALLCVCVIGAHGCTVIDNPQLVSDSGTEDTTSSGDGDGDGDPGDGDGDGDGDPTTGDGDGDPSDLPQGPCDVWMQDCSEGEKCVPYASEGSGFDNHKCVPVTGSGAAGDPCTYGGSFEATDDCGYDLYCWDVEDIDGMQIGTCTEFCGGTPNEPICAPGSTCVALEAAIVPLCVLACDPLLQDCPGGDEACFWDSVQATFGCLDTVGDIPLGEPCGFINDCVAGTMCLNAGVLPSCNGSGCCGSFCSVSDPTCPAGGTECVEFFEPGMAPPGYEDVGVCVLPGA